MDMFRRMVCTKDDFKPIAKCDGHVAVQRSIQFARISCNEFVHALYSEEVRQTSDQLFCNSYPECFGC